MIPVGPASSPSGVFLLSEALSFENAPEHVPSELPKVSETFLICPVMLGPTSRVQIPKAPKSAVGRTRTIPSLAEPSPLLDLGMVLAHKALTETATTS